MQFYLIFILDFSIPSPNAVEHTARREEKKRKGDCNNEPCYP